MCLRKDVERLIKEVEDNGYTVKRTKKSHYVVYCPNGLYVISSTPSSYSTLRKSRAGLKRYGVKLRHTDKHQHFFMML